MLLIAAVAALIAWGGWYLAQHSTPVQTGGRFGGRGGAAGPGGRAGGLPTPVGAGTAVAGDIHVVLNALGTVTPQRDVTVTAQVSGQLLDVAYKEGQMVAKGDVLAQIDPRTYQAALGQAQGSLARDQALLTNAKIDLARYQTLFKEDSIAKQQLDAQASLVRQYEGTIQADQGTVDSAKVNLAYTRILAPVGGRVGLRQVDPGNNVASGSSIVVITRLAPIDVLFTIPEDNLPGVQKKLHSDETLTVEAWDRSGKSKLAGGELASLDNQIDTSTGTVKAKAEFGNDDQALFPNQFVNIKLLLDTLHGVTIIPTSALQRGSNGLFVYVINDDHTVSVRVIKTGTTEGERVQVTDGIKPGEMVVTDGGDRLREGSAVTLPKTSSGGVASSLVDTLPSPASDDASGSGHHGHHRHGGWGSGAHDGSSGQHDWGSGPHDGSSGAHHWGSGARDRASGASPASSGGDGG
jgi:multidrug efflux system membrane fusion protein